MDFNQLGLGNLDLTPSVSLAWKGSNHSNEITGKVSGRVAIMNLSTRTTVSRAVNLSTSSELVEYKDTLRGQVSYKTGDLSPKVSYSVSRNLLTHPNFGRKSRLRGDLSLTLTWKPVSNLSSELRGGVKYKPDSGFTYSLKEVVNWKLIPELTPEASLDLKYIPKSDEWDFSVESGFSYPIRNRWGISFTSGFNWGIEETGEVYNSFFGSAGLQVKF